MAKTLEQLAADMEKLTTTFETKEKEFKVLLQASNDQAAQWKTVAEQSQAKILKLEEDAKKAEANTLKLKTEAIVAENRAFVEAKKKEGILTPAMAIFAESLMGSMTSDAEVVKFTEKDGRAVVHTQLSLFKAFIGTLKKAVSYGPISPGSRQVAGAPVHEAGEVRKMEVTVKSLGRVEATLDDYDLHMKALEFQAERAKSGKTITYEEALIEASKQEKDAANAA